MSRSFLTLLHFDGTEFLGWQRQARGRTVQGEVERVLARLAGRPVAAHAAGRTDAGVHALGLAVSFAMPDTWNADALRRALNALLPRDIWVAALHEMRAGFHARKDAASRRYQYDIGCDDAANSPFRRRFEWAINRPLDGAVLQDAAALLQGEHDFRAFSAKTEPKPHYLCRLSDARWEARPAGRGWRFHVEADRFLQHMVRMLVGTMVDLGLGRRPAGDMHRLMARTDNAETSPPAPPHGLYFVRAAYAPSLYLAGLLLAFVAAGCGRADAGPAGSAASAQGESLALATFGSLQQVQRGIDQSRRTAIVSAAARIAPAVVSVSVQSHQRAQPSPYDFFFTPEGDQLVQGVGTGFIVRQDGTVITNQHVVEGAESITVTLNDGTELPATLVGQDATTDIAVLKVDRSGLPVAPIGKSSDLMIGEWVIAMGNPYRFLLSNVEPTVTAGVVSAVGRNILPSSGQPGLYLDMIQTDAAINPGNSGGPLANALGEVVGVNSNILSNTGSSVGVGFAIPIERVMRVASEIQRTGEMHRAWTGIEIAGARQMQFSRTADGIRVERVAPGSPAAVAGFKAGDVLLGANGRRLRTWLDWEAVKLDVAVGDTVQVEVQGASGTTRRRIRTGELPSATAERITVVKELQLVTMTPAIRVERHIAAERGVLIYRISDQAQRVTGLQEGDVILAINNTRMEAASDVSDAFERLRNSRGFRVFFERSGRILFADLRFT